MKEGILQINASDLRDFFLDLLNEFSSKNENGKNELITANEVCDMLHITRPTLWKWSKTGYLKNIHIGKKVMYKLSDVLKIKNGGYNNG